MCLNFIRLKLWESNQIIWEKNLVNKQKLHLLRQIKSYYAFPFTCALLNLSYVCMFQHLK